jgi:phospholipid/cholesterol/gamma-HCH transport system substrate-binding protein
MKDQRKTEIKVGVTVIVGLIILLWIYGWAKNFTINSQRKEVSVEFTSVSGLSEGDPVTVNGVKKGYVKKIVLINGKVTTLLNFDPDVYLAQDAKFSVMMLDLMGGKKIEVNPGLSDKSLDYTKMQQGNLEGDIASAMVMVGTIQNDLVDVIKEVKVSLTTLNKTLADQKFSNDLKTSVSNLAQLTDGLNALVQNNSAEINKLLKTGTELAKNTNEFIVSNRDSISQTISSVHSALKVSKELLAKVNDFMDKTDKSQNNLGKLMNDTTLVDDLKASIQQVRELTKVLLDQLKSTGMEIHAHIKLF